MRCPASSLETLFVKATNRIWRPAAGHCRRRLAGAGVLGARVRARTPPRALRTLPRRAGLRHRGAGRLGRAGDLVKRRRPARVGTRRPGRPYTGVLPGRRPRLRRRVRAARGVVGPRVAHRALCRSTSAPPGGRCSDGARGSRLRTRSLNIRPHAHVLAATALPRPRPAPGTPARRLAGHRGRCLVHCAGPAVASVCAPARRSHRACLTACLRSCGQCSVRARLSFWSLGILRTQWSKSSPPSMRSLPGPPPTKSLPVPPFTVSWP